MSESLYGLSLLNVADPNKDVWGRDYVLASVKLVFIGRGSNKVSCMSYIELRQVALSCAEICCRYLIDKAKWCGFMSCVELYDLY